MAFSPDAALSFLQNAHRHGRLGHAYLISGAAGAGKRQLATRLAELVNPADADDIFAMAQSAVYLAEPSSKSRRIVIEQIRDLEHALQMRAPPGRKKVAIISDADRLQPQAANAFLKTLEEPPNDSLLLLLSALPEALPDTIVSRCIAIPLASPKNPGASSEELKLIVLLKEMPLSSGIQPAYQLAQRLQSLLRNVRDEIQAEYAAALKAEEVRYKNTTDGAWLDDREDHFKALTESTYLQRRAALIEVLFRWWSDVLRASTGLPADEIPQASAETAAMAAKLRTPECLKRIRRVEELRDQLGRNIQEALALEVACLSLFRF